MHIRKHLAESHHAILQVRSLPFIAVSDVASQKILQVFSQNPLLLVVVVVVVVVVLVVVVVVVVVVAAAADLDRHSTRFFGF